MLDLLDCIMIGERLTIVKGDVSKYTFYARLNALTSDGYATLSK